MSNESEALSKFMPILAGSYPEELGATSMDMIRMEPEEAICVLREMLPEKEDYGEMVGAPGWAHGMSFVYDGPEG